MEEKKSVGRPTLYKDEYIETAREFFSKVHWDEEYKVWKFPSRVWLADHLGVALQTVKDWEKAHPEFGQVIVDGIEKSKELRIVWAENDKVNGMFARFVLSSAYGMSDKQSIEVGQKDDKPWSINLTLLKE